MSDNQESLRELTKAKKRVFQSYDFSNLEKTLMEKWGGLYALTEVPDVIHAKTDLVLHCQHHGDFPSLARKIYAGPAWLCKACQLEKVDPARRHLIETNTTEKIANRRKKTRDYGSLATLTRNKESQRK